jgi:hypothetical protein
MTKTFGYHSIIASSTGEIGQVRSINGPGADFADVDTTCMDSTSNFRTFSAGLGDGGEVTLALLYDPSAHAPLANALGARTTKYWTIYHGSSSGDTDTFYAYVKSIGRTIPMDDMIAADVTLKVTGIPGYTT